VLAEWMRPDGLTLELGCGAGVFADVSERWVGLDLSLEALREVRARGRWAVCCDVAQLPIRDGVVQNVLSFDTLEHVYEPDRVLEEVARVVAPGGRALLRDAWLKTEKRSGWRIYKLRKRWARFAVYFPRLWRELRRDDRVARSRIEPDYSEIGCDFDAVSRIDPHSVFRYFRSRGFVALNEHRDVLRRITSLWSQHRNWVVVEKRRDAG
jgi:SAM-dependent methyltransferase